MKTSQVGFTRSVGTNAAYYQSRLSTVWERLGILALKSLHKIKYENLLKDKNSIKEVNTITSKTC